MCAWTLSHIHTHTHTHTYAGRQGIRRPQAPSRPLNTALMGGGIDRPSASVIVSRWITVSRRKTQKRKKEERQREGRGEREEGKNEGSNPLLLQETGPYPGRKDLIPHTPNLSPPSSPSSLLSPYPCVALSLSAAEGQLCLSCKAFSSLWEPVEEIDLCKDFGVWVPQSQWCIKMYPAWG